MGAKGIAMRDVVDVCLSLGVHPELTMHGVRIGCTGWRLEQGGGIAGNLGTWWLRTIAGQYHPSSPDATAKPIGPLRTRHQLKRAIQQKWPTQTKNLACGLPRTPSPATPGAGK